MRMDILLLCGGVAAGLTLVAPVAWLVVLTDGLLAAAVLAGATGWGAWPVSWMGLGRRRGTVQICVAAGLGLGWLGTVTLGLGVAGALSRPLAWGLLATGGLCGLWRLARLKPAERESLPATRADRRWGTATALLLAVPLVVTLLGATLPPGVLWPEEAFGYDVLEYHLQAPREYYDAGRIRFLPHNVYASFPEQMEMLYLLLMYLDGGAHAAAIPAQFLHAGCGILAVLALGAWVGHRRGRVVTLLAAGATPWLAYLGCLAYVEDGMVLFAAIAGGLALDTLRAEEPGGGWRAALTAGLCAGLAGACKYTAIAMVAAALGIAWVVTMRRGWKTRLRLAVVYGAGVLAALSPWLVRNAVQAGNPVYPFAYSWFGGRAWSAAQAAQWSRAHRVPEEFDSLRGRVRLGLGELLGRTQAPGKGYVPSLFGAAMLLAGIGGWIAGRGRGRAMLLIWSGLIVAIWLGLTFVPGRFAVVLVVPLALLGGIGTAATRGAPRSNVDDEGARRRAGVGRSVVLPAVVLIGAAIGDVTLVGRCRTAAEWFARAHGGVPLVAAIGQTQAMVRFCPLNEALPDNAYVWLVGDARAYYITRRLHYTVVFNHDPWVELAAGGAPPAVCLQWLRHRGVTHVAFAWEEIERLRRTYGFPAIVTRAWVQKLEQAGLERVEPDESLRRSGYDVYRVAGAGS